MPSFRRKFIPLLLLLLGVMACVVPVAPIGDPGAGATSVAQTVEAIIEMTRQATGYVDDISTDTPTTVPTSTPTATGTLVPTFTLPPSLTPTASSTPTLVPSATSLVPTITVSVATNCRVGPGKIYKQVGVLLEGQVAQVYGRTSDSSYWYIRSPSSPSIFCWVWGEYATLYGPIAVLPVYTPPPTPTPTITNTPAPAFKAEYDGRDSCNGWYVDLLLRNTGSLAFKSVSITVKDTVTSTVVSRVTDGFINRNGCNSGQKDVLQAGKSVLVSSALFTYNPHGHKLRATITACSNTGLNGLCVTNSITFTP